MEPRAVSAGHGWQWIVDGFSLFRKNPIIWITLILVLYITFTILVRVPILGIVIVLLMPVLLAGLMEGCRALDTGQNLKITHLICGFQKNTAHLVTLGGISLVGNLLVLIIGAIMTGDAAITIMKSASGGAADPAAAEAVLRAAPKVFTAALIALTFSLPLLMALWYAPLLVYFENLKPARSLVVSFGACWKNVLPFLVYGTVILIGILALTPISVSLRQFDLSIWLLAPVLIPSIYASYKDIFTPATSPAASGGGKNPFLK